MGQGQGTVGYGQIEANGVRYVKINKIDGNGTDRSAYLNQLEQLTIKYSDIGTKVYQITNIQEQPTSYLYSIYPFVVQPTGANDSVNYTVLDYSFLATKTNPTVNSGKVDFGDRITSYDSITGNTLGYFTASSGTYIAGNTPNVILKIRISGSGTGDSGGNLQFWIVRDPFSADRVEYTIASSYGGGTFDATYFITSSFNIIETNKFGFALFKTGGTISVNKVHISMSMHQANVNSPSTPLPLIVFEPDYINFTYNDYNPLLGNADANNTSNAYMEIDYIPSSLTPINFNQIINGVAIPAQIQDSNYASKSWSNIRYNGSRQSAYDFNKPFTSNNQT